jgi:filamentous hemagglutinin
MGAGGLGGIGFGPKKPPNPYGKLGKPSTRVQNTEIANELEAEGYEITGGGGRTKEEYIPSPYGTRKGSVSVDITATKPGDTVRVQTVDTLESGVPTPREMTNAGKILKADRNGGIFLIPKQ